MSDALETAIAQGAIVSREGHVATVAPRPSSERHDVRYNKPDLTGAELTYAAQCLDGRAIAGDGPFTARCHAFLEQIYGASVLLTHSCTAALEMAAILADLKAGDEVIMPSFTFVSTANAVVLRGAVPVFVDIRPDTLNIDERLVEAAITDRTRAIMPVHYAGVGAAMAPLMAIALKHDLIVIEDAAQGFAAEIDGRRLGAIGKLGCLSFHESKNVVSGEGGALLINDPALVDRATFIREKGTNRTQFLRKEVSKYEWIDIGSSFLPSDLLAAVLLAQLERSQVITQRRLEIWNRYHRGLQPLAEFRCVRLPSPPKNTLHNGHIYWLVCRTPAMQQRLIGLLKGDGIQVQSHYIPLHSAPAGLRFGRVWGSMAETDAAAYGMVRLPMHSGLSDDEVDYVVARTLHHTRAVAG